MWMVKMEHTLIALELNILQKKKKKKKKNTRMQFNNMQKVLNQI